MGKATGIFLILAGIGSAALVLPKVDADAEKQLADVVRIATGNAPPAVEASAPAPAVRVQAAIPSSMQSTISGRDPAPRPGKDLAVAPPQREASVAPPVLVTPPQPVVRNSAPIRSDDSQSRVTLARDIQKELKRVGCYDGEISGEWNAATKRAMAQFINRLNAALPSEEPDHILRAMVQGYPGNACGRGATTGIVAQAGTKVAPKPVEHSVPRDIATARPTVPKPAWETSVAIVMPPPPTPKPIAPEGRMAVGAPIAVVPAPTVTGSINAAELKPIAPATASVALGTAPALPGTIAALSSAVVSPEQGVKAVVPSDEFAAAERRARQRDRERRQAASESAQVFPQAYRLGATSQKYFASAPEPYTERRTFTQRFFDKQKNGFDNR